MRGSFLVNWPSWVSLQNASICQGALDCSTWKKTDPSKRRNRADISRFSCRNSPWVIRRQTTFSCKQIQWKITDKHSMLPFSRLRALFLSLRLLACLSLPWSTSHNCYPSSSRCKHSIRQRRICSSASPISPLPTINSTSSAKC